MRVSDASLFQSVATAADTASSNEANAQAEVSTGLAFTQPGDDPVAAGDAIRAQASATLFESIGNTVTSANNDLQTADGALSNIENSLNTAQQLAEEYSNGTWTASQLASGAQQVQGIISTIIGDLNTQSGSGYVFGGTANSSPPFSTTGQFTGNDNARTIEVAPGVTQDVSVPVGGLMTGTNGGANVLGTLQNLVTALSNNDLDGIQATLDPLQTGLTDLATTRANAGTDMSVLSAASTASQTAQQAATTTMSSLTNADAIKASSNLALAQEALQAALSGASTTFHLFLFDQQ